WAGAGRFQLQVVLGAVVEAEGRVAGAADDSRSAAQSLDTSAVALPGSASRVAVVGAINQSPVNVATGKPVSAVGGSFNGAALSTLTDGTFLSRGTFWASGTIWWTDSAGSLDIDLGGPHILSGAKLQADDNNASALDYMDPADGQWKLLWDVPNYDTRISSGMITRPDFGNSDTQEW